MAAVDILRSLDANKQSLLAKEQELQGFLQEKTNIQKSIETMDKVTIPNLLNIISKNQLIISGIAATRNQALKDATADYDDAVVKTIEAQDDLSKKTSLASLWYGRFHQGCNWDGYKGFQGSYCGDFAVACTKKQHDFTANAPSGCLKADVRKQRNDFAETAANVSASNRNSAKAKYDAAKLREAEALSVKNSFKNGTDIGSENIKKADIELQKAKANYASYVGVNGLRAREQNRIAYVDQRILETTNVIQNINREKSLMEAEYQKFVAEEATKAKLLKEASDKAAAERDRLAKIQAASIDANIAASDPTTMALKAKSNDNKMMYGVLGLGIIVAGVYLLKKN